ncbi:glycosyltransferase family 2 protein [Weissella paramesenteroides]|uniref:Glycosyltransferase, group 2 family protein n=1 Tax=Weissella paramesenteroides ATCC 33313 TaxID=585506 RepID=C5RB63_WEIPA|nr:glycosyltransferase family 2 protein [Weissella paramesenteroides]ATF41864.1 glycosyltransferase family 2 protein [Weissella paramesenteroides]EER74732.1 glycosyltransferase, group 2 family protein [Weissella paramesenteroides ATCC 33313]
MLLSVIIPSFNCTEKLSYIIESLNYILTCEKEIIIVDDGSSNTSKEILKSIENKNRQVKVIFNNHTGVSIARNTGIGISKGDYITFIDDDDEIYPDAYSKMIQQVLLHPELDIVSTSINVSEEHNMKIYNKQYEIENIILSNLQINTEMFKADEYPSGPCAKFFKRRLLFDNKILFPTNVFNGEDLIFNCYALLHCKNVQLLQGKVYKYFQNNNSLMHSYSPKMQENNVLFADAILKFLNFINDFDYNQKKLVSEYWKIRLSMTNILRQYSIKVNNKDVFLKDIRLVQRGITNPSLMEFLSHNFSNDQIIFIKMIGKCPIVTIIPITKFFKWLKYHKNNFRSAIVEL